MIGLSIRKNYASGCAEQVIPVILTVERGFSDEHIMDWIEESLSKVFNRTEFCRLVTVYSQKVEEIYGHIRIGAQDVCPSALSQYLSSPPKSVKALKLG